MAQYKKIMVVVEAITFDDLVTYGKEHGGNIVDGMPWSFEYFGQPITHENNDCYLVPTPMGITPFRRSDMLVICSNGRIRFTCPRILFFKLYEPV